MGLYELWKYRVDNFWYHDCEEICLINKSKESPVLESTPTTEAQEIKIVFVEEPMIKKMTFMMEVRLQKALKGRNISVRDVVSHMSDGIFIRNIFLISKWKLAICLDSCVFLAMAGMVTCMMYDAMGYDLLLLYLINHFLQSHFWILIPPPSKFGQ